MFFSSFKSKWRILFRKKHEQTKNKFQLWIYIQTFFLRLLKQAFLLDLTRPYIDNGSNPAGFAFQD